MTLASFTATKIIKCNSWNTDGQHNTPNYINIIKTQGIKSRVMCSSLRWYSESRLIYSVLGVQINAKLETKCILSTFICTFLFQEIHIFKFSLLLRTDWLTFVVELFFCQIGISKKGWAILPCLGEMVSASKGNKPNWITKVYLILIIELGRTFIYFKIITKV